MATKTAETAEPTRTPIDGPLEGMVVRYVGTSNLRSIKVKEWVVAIGREHPQVDWFRDSPRNDVAVSRFDLDQVEFARCILGDQDFRLINLAVERASN